MVLTGLLFKWFINNALTFPNHLIHISKQDVLNIETINFSHNYSAVNLTDSSTIDLSKLVNFYLYDKTDDTYSRESVKFNLEGLYSLKNLQSGVKISEVEFSVKNLPSLTRLYLSISGTIDEDILSRLLDQLQHIEELYLNLDHLVNLRELSLSGTIDKSFNLELFKNLCNQLEDITIKLKNIDENTFIKLFDGCYKFPYLVDFSVRYVIMKTLKKEFIDRFRTLRRLNINNCNIEVIEYDAFSNLQQLSLLDLRNNRIEFIEEDAFSTLKNLQQVDFSFNNLIDFDPKFIGLRESVEFNIQNNNYKTYN